MPCGQYVRFTDVRDTARQLKQFTVREFARKLRVRPPTARNHIQVLLDKDVIRVSENPPEHMGPGRPPVYYEFVRPDARVVNRPKVTPPEIVTAQQEAVRVKKLRQGISGRRAKTGNKRSDELVRAAAKAGAAVRIKNNNHVEVEYNGQRETLALTPSQGSARADRDKLRKLGLAV